MPFVYVGLAKGRTSYWDPMTRTRLDLKDSHKKVFYKEVKDLDNITHAILSSEPTLVPYGKYPEEAIERWIRRFGGFFKTESPRLIRDLNGNLVQESKNRALDRAEALLEAQKGLEEPTAPETPQEPENKPTEPETEPEKEDEVEGAQVEVAEKKTKAAPKAKKETPKVEEKVETKTTSSKAATKSKK